MDIEGELLFQDDVPANHRSGFVAIVGKPNVGKSTLLNAWLGIKLAAVSPKPQTTRNRFLGILTRPDAQVIFIDTPGIHAPRTRLGEHMVRAARQAIPEADVVLFLVDGSAPPRRADRDIAAMFQGLSGQVILAINKMDAVTIEDLETNVAGHSALAAFDETVCISATRGDNCDELLEAVVSRLPLGPRYYPEDQLSDQHERFVAAEMIREQALRHLQQEVPHAIAVVVDEFKERDNNSLYVSANLYVEKTSQKGIVIGRKGSMLKRIGQDARVELETFFERPVYVDLWVKVRKDWRRDDRFLRELGYSG